MMQKMKSGACKVWAQVPLHLILGILFFAHGSQKLFGWFGGPGLEGTGQFLTSLGFAGAGFFALVTALVEFVGGIFLFVGFMTHITALVLIIDMLVALFAVHASNGFFLANGGAEFVLLILAGLLTLFLGGAAPCSLDAKLGWCPCCKSSCEKGKCLKCGAEECKCG